MVMNGFGMFVALIVAVLCFFASMDDDDGSGQATSF